MHLDAKTAKIAGLRKGLGHVGILAEDVQHMLVDEVLTAHVKRHNVAFRAALGWAPQNTREHVIDQSSTTTQP